MERKIFSAKHIKRGIGSFQEARKLTHPDFSGEAWVFADFKQDNGKIKEIYQKIVNSFEQGFFQNKSEDIFEALEDALKVVNDSIKDDIKNLEEGVFQEGGFLIGLFHENSLYFTSCGTPEVYFIRQKNFTLISEGLSEQNGEDTFINVANGDLRDDDKVIFTTNRLLRYATGNQIADSMQSGVEESIDALKFLIPDNENIALGIFHFKSERMLPLGRDKKESKFISKVREGRGSSYFNNLFDKLGITKWQHKNTAIVFAGLIGLLLISMFFAMISEQKNDEQAEVYREEIVQMQKDLEIIDTKSLEEANNIISHIEERARSINSQGYFIEDVVKILDRTQDKKDKINGVMRFSGVKIISEFPENTLGGVFEHDADYYVYGEKTLYQILAVGGDTKNTSVLTENEKIIDGENFPSKKQMIFLSDNGKIIEYKDGESSFATTSDDKFEKGVSIATFSKYMYLLDPASNEIWKYEKNDSGFSGAKTYNADGEIQKGISLAIDGSVFVLTSDGDLIKLYSGKVQNYAIKNAPDGKLKGITKVFTNENLANLYFLNPQESSILIFSKGQNEAYYQKQIVIEDTENITDFWIDPETDRLIFTDNSKLYELKLP